MDCAAEQLYLSLCTIQGLTSLLAAVIRLLLAEEPVIEPYLEKEGDGILMQPPGGASEFIAEPQFGIVADSKELVACCTAYRFQDPVTVLFFSEVGFLQNAGVVPGNTAITNGGLSPDSASGSNYHVPVAQTDLRKVVTMSNLREAISVLSKSDRSRSRDRQSPNNTTTSPHNPNLYISRRQPLSDITPSPNHRSQLHQSLWTATTTPPNASSSTPSASWTMTPQRDPTGHPY